VNDPTSRGLFAKAPSSRGCPTRQAATLRDRGLAPPASSELPALSRAVGCVRTEYTLTGRP
jgi:hypothetical protein